VLSQAAGLAWHPFFCRAKPVDGIFRSLHKQGVSGLCCALSGVAQVLREADGIRDRRVCPVLERFA